MEQATQEITKTTWTSEELKMAVDKVNWKGLYAVGKLVRINGACGSKVTLKPVGDMTLDAYIEFAKQEHSEIRKNMPRKQSADPSRHCTQLHKKPRLSTLESEPTSECSSVIADDNTSHDSKTILLMKLLESFQAKKQLDPDRFVALCFNYQEACKKMEAEQKLLFDYVMSRL